MQGGRSIMPFITWLLLQILHILYSGYLGVLALVDSFCSLPLRLQFMMSPGGLLRKEIREIRLCMEKKKPRAMALVLTDKIDGKTSLPDLAKLLVWLAFADVQHVAVYDLRGVMKSFKELLVGEIEYHLEGLAEKGSDDADDEMAAIVVEPSFTTLQLQSLEETLAQSASTKSSIQEKHLSSTFPGCHEWQANGRLLGMSDMHQHRRPLFPKAGFLRKMHVELLSYEDGRPALARAAERLCTMKDDAKLNRNGLKVVDTNSANEDLETLLLSSGMARAMDPDIVLLLGKAPFTGGFPPWRLKQSEIVHVGSLKGFQLHNFLKVMRKYAESEQRFGK